MKIKSGYFMREVAGNYIVVPLGATALDFNGLITLNETGAFLWKQLTDEKTEKELLGAILNEYDTDETTARADAKAFLVKLKAADLLE
ncbi:MAG: PqqD family protein [Bacillota bacterium]|nr:PqqD family protein [Bacillota bacterium]